MTSQSVKYIILLCRWPNKNLYLFKSFSFGNTFFRFWKSVRFLCVGKNLV